jgi:L-rhamnose isomerase
MVGLTVTGHMAKNGLLPCSVKCFAAGNKKGKFENEGDFTGGLSSCSTTPVVADPS